MIYLASPFTHPEHSERVGRYISALEATYKLLSQGQFVFSPIVHCYEISLMYGTPGDHEFWQAYDEHMLGLADTLYVLRIDGWEESKGVQSEIEFARANNIPVVYIDG